MKTRYFLELSFKGSHYHGWQSQLNASTVQSELEQALWRITGEKIRTVGAGRTDAGVHAKFFVVHLDSNEELFFRANDFLYKVNSVLPADIAVHRIYPVKSDIHARFSAISRKYEYWISQQKDPFMDEISWTLTRDIDISVMNEAAEKLKFFTDFTSFSKLHSNVKTNHCRIIRAGWEKRGHILVFAIEADRFLRNMVRAIVGTLVSVGTGKISVEEFIRIIESKDRSMAKSSAPAHGLSLVNIIYPEDIRLQSHPYLQGKSREN